MRHNPKLKFPPSLAHAAIALAALLLSSCSKQSVGERHLKKADAYYEAGQYPEAEIEYKNVLQAEPLNPRAISRLGLIYVDDGIMTKAFPILIKGRELEPDNLELRTKLASVERDAGRIGEARNDALYVLGKDPLNQPALLLLASTSVKPKESEETEQRLQQLRASSPSSSAAALALGAFKFRKHDLAGSEIELRRAVELDPKSSEAYSALGALLVAKHDMPGADKALASAADLAPARSPLRLQYAQFRIQSKDPQGAQAMLEKTTQTTPDYLPAWLLLAEIEATQRKFAESDADIAKVLARDPVNPEALLLGAQVMMANGDDAKAIESLERTLRLYPNSPQVLYELGQAYLASGDTAKAVTELVQAVTFAPDFVDAVTLLAEANIRKGDFNSAAVSMRQLIQKHPDNPRIWVLLADAYRNQGDLDAAVDIYRQMDARFPRDPGTSLLTGMILAQQNKKDEARKSFLKALEVSPEYMPAIEQLINLDLADKNYPDALKRANDEVAKNPKMAIPVMFLAKIYVAQNDSAQAEKALLRAIELQPDQPTAYLLLARLYAATNREQSALADLKKVVGKNPKDVGALMMIAIVQDEQKEYAEARDTYEKILAINPRFSSALNNLAYIYSERFGETDKALAMAQRARELLPNEPHAADTLGWILFKRRQYPWALSLLQESASKLPADADVQFHSGMTRYMMGQEGPARSELQLALKLQKDFPGAEEARKRLEVLAIDPNTSTPGDREILEKSLALLPNDPVVLVKLAAIDQREGKFEKAATGIQAAMVGNPADVKAQLALIRLYMGQHKVSEAMEVAKQARKTAPDDPEVARLIGSIAYEAGDYPWSYSLLQESARAQPEDPDVLFDLARASLSVGRVSDAEATMRHAIQVGVPPARAEEAKRFADLVGLLDHPDLASAEATRVDRILKTDPGYLPALAVAAENEDTRHDTAGSVATYSSILGKYPQFVPAERRLAILYSEDPGKDDETTQLAGMATEFYPGDPELSKALGIVTYRQGKYSRAADLFKASEAGMGTDAELKYYIGLTQIALKNQDAGRKALQSALDLGLKGDQAINAKRVIGGLN